MNFCDVCGKPKGVGRCEHCAEKERHHIAEMIAERQAAVAHQVESERRLARYDEAIRLLRLREPGCSGDGEFISSVDLNKLTAAFLAAEPKEGR